MTQRASMSIRMAVLAVAVAVTVSCATNPATGKKELNLMSEAQEVALGKESDAQIRQEMGIVNDAALQQYGAPNAGLPKDVWVTPPVPNVASRSPADV